MYVHFLISKIAMPFSEIKKLSSFLRREFGDTYKPGNPSRTRGHAYLFYIFPMIPRNFNEIQRSILLIMIIC